VQEVAEDMEVKSDDSGLKGELELKVEVKEQGKFTLDLIYLEPSESENNEVNVTIFLLNIFRTS
jgi:NAD(P)H-flavin reductase